MHTNPTSPPDAVTALRDAVTRGTDHILVACAECGWDDDGQLALVDESFRQIGVPTRVGSVRLGRDDDAEDNAVECGGCLAGLDFDLVILRDRRGRCAQALAEAA